MKGLLLDLPDLVAPLPGDARETLKEQLVVTREAVRANPMEHGHPPHVYQEMVHAEEAGNKLVLFLAANRLGKSECGMRETLWRARGEHPYKEVPFISVIWIGILDFTFYKETTLFHWRKWAPAEWIIKDLSENNKHAILRRADGGECHIFIKTYEQGRESWQGAGVDYIWIDEEPPEDVYGEARARLVTTRGGMLLTLTALTGVTGWIYDGLYIPLKKGDKKGLLVEGALATEDPEREWGVGESLVPHMTREDIVSFASDYKDPVERRMRVFGIYGVRTGTVYQFHPQIHLIPPFDIPDYFEIWGSVDPGYRGFAGHLYGMSEMGIAYVIGEVFSQEEDHATRFGKLNAMVQARAPWMTADRPCIFYVDTEDPQTVLQLNILARETGSAVTFASLDQGLKAVKAGIMRTASLLLPSKENPTPPHVHRPRPAAGEPSLYIFNDLQSEWINRNKDGTPIQTVTASRLVWELGRFAWKKGNKDEADEASAGGAHALAALRYGMMARMGPPAAPIADQYKQAGADASKWERIHQQVFGGDEE